MAAITGTLAKRTEFGGDYKLFVITATAESASDTITLTAATHGLTEITGIVGQVTGGLDADFATLQVSYSGLVITVVSKNAAGSSSTSWTDTTYTLFVIGK